LVETLGCHWNRLRRLTSGTHLQVILINSEPQGGHGGVTTRKGWAPSTPYWFTCIHTKLF
jgi:hypothetical protein